MATKEKMEKYLNKKADYVETVDKLFVKKLKQAEKDQKAYKKKMEKMLIRDEQGVVHEITDVEIHESEDGVGTMTYTAMHPHGGQGRLGYNKDASIRKRRRIKGKCPYCGKDLKMGD